MALRDFPLYSFKQIYLMWNLRLSIRFAEFSILDDSSNGEVLFEKSMLATMTEDTKRDQVRELVIAKVASEL